MRPNGYFGVPTFNFIRVGSVPKRSITVSHKTEESKPSIRMLACWMTMSASVLRWQTACSSLHDQQTGTKVFISI